MRRFPPLIHQCENEDYNFLLLLKEVEGEAKSAKYLLKWSKRNMDEGKNNCNNFPQRGIENVKKEDRSELKKKKMVKNEDTSESNNSNRREKNGEASIE